MSDSGRSFWASVPGLITGLAGLLTGLVGLVSLSIQQGWIGGGSGKGSSATTTTAIASGQSTTTSSLSTGTADFSVAPLEVQLKAVGTKDATVTVTNTGVAPLTISTVLSGTNGNQFRVDDADCAARRVERNGNCKLQVSFVGSLQASTASLFVRAAEVSQPKQVTLKGSLA